MLIFHEKNIYDCFSRASSKKIDGVVRAKLRLYIPLVFTHQYSPGFLVDINTL